MRRASSYPWSHLLLALAVAMMWFAVCKAGSAVAGDTLRCFKADGHYYYYPPGEKEIIARLSDAVPAMLRMLELHQLAVKAPVHIVLDAELDAPAPVVHMIPHREIRIPLKAPGVFEDGWLEPDPWSYFLFNGLCLQAIYGMRLRLPALAHKGFGEIVSPNIVLPDWITDGVCHLLYTRYNPNHPIDPLNDAVFRSTEVPALDAVSNHSERWPGHYGYRIFGRPFIRWIVERHGWSGLHGFLEEHAGGVIPFEIDFKVERRLGASWPELWRLFTEQNHRETEAEVHGADVLGYWPNPFIFWNRTGVFPGVEKTGYRGRFGFVDHQETLWLSQYDDDGISTLVRYKGDQPVWVENESIWDPGPGGVAVTRDGHRPCLVVFSTDVADLISRQRLSTHVQFDKIPGPEGVIQLSGPVMDGSGRIVVAGNSGGNWDIWMYDAGWRRLTDGRAAEIDPWFDGQTILHATDQDGTFQISDLDGGLRSRCKTAAVMPRDGHFLCLTAHGWVPRTLLPSGKDPVRTDTADRDGPRGGDPAMQPMGGDRHHPSVSKNPEEGSPASETEGIYRPFGSLLPNYMKPELFFSNTDLQVGVATFSRDVTGDYTLDGGVRYSTDSESWSLRAGASALGVGLRFARYPLAYTTVLDQSVDEMRREIKAFWWPWESDNVELSFNYRSFEAQPGGSDDDESWAGLHLADTYGRHGGWMDLEWYSDGSCSLYGGGRLLFGETVYSMLHLQAGKTWGPLSMGHNTFRIGGNVMEGYFTQRPSRLFPLRGFDSSILDAGQIVTSGLEVFLPLANLQAGYHTLPLFLHRMMLGTFVDAGAAAEPFTSEDILVGGGVELVTSMEIAWGNFSSFRIGLAWPLHQPDGVDQKGPIFLIQLGKPL